MIRSEPWFQKRSSLADEVQSVLRSGDLPTQYAWYQRTHGEGFPPNWLGTNFNALYDQKLLGTLEEQYDLYQTVKGVGFPGWWMGKNFSFLKEQGLFSVTYSQVVFAQGEDAVEPLSILDRQGEDAAIEYLAQWDSGSDEASTSPRPSHSPTDHTHISNDLKYLLSYNLRVGYIGLERIHIDPHKGTAP